MDDHMTTDKTVDIRPDDVEMNAAIAEARRTFGCFLDAYFHPGYGQHAFLLKVEFEAGDDTEYLWVADLDLRHRPFRGVIANEPNTVQLKLMQPVEFEVHRIADWMYIDHGRLIGGFTTRLLRSRMSADERLAYDAQAPYSLD